MPTRGSQAMRPTPPFPPVVPLLQQLVEERLGLRYAEGDFQLLVDRVLARARVTGCPPPALRLPALPDIARRSMSRHRDGSVEVNAELIARVRWHQVNLLDRAAVRALGTFDVILCRNVFIYFTERATRT